MEQAQDLSANAGAGTTLVHESSATMTDDPNAAGTILTIPDSGAIEVTFLPTGKGELKEIPGFGTVLESNEDGKIIR